MTYRLGKASERNLIGVYPALVQAVRLAISYTAQDFCILPGGGVRSRAMANANAARGTGISNSLHIPQADGYSHAVDLVAYEGGPTWGKNREDKLRLYMPIRAAMFRACDELRLPIQHGADWDLDGVLEEPGEWDWPHFQIPNLPHRLEAATQAMHDRIAGGAV